ncbi:MAG: hypothetical protein KDC24_05735 [Saprospiraceae bacterium]|nr:hypothetical protein [Saprospiraceae bacterium]
MKGLLFLAIPLFLLSACSPTLTSFTKEIYNDNNWTEDELRQIQFYLSEDIVLTRQRKGARSVIEDGAITMEKGKEVDEIVIPKGTPGVFLFSPKKERMAISFEEGNEKRFLMFGPNPKMGDRFVLLASEWDKKRGKVKYDDSYYWVASDDAFAGLMVDLKSINKVKVKTQVASGNKVN